MASAELAVVPDDPAAIAERDIVDGWVQMASSVFKLADHISHTDFVPRAYRGNAPATAAAILTGRELNMGPMMSLRHVQVVEGTPSLSAEYKRARVLAAGHEFNILEWTNFRCRVKGRRRGSGEPPLEITYSMDDADRAGLRRPRSGWEKRPRRMLFARAGTDLCDALFADVTNGLPTTELLTEPAGDDDGFGGYDEAAGQAAAKPAARTARRKTAAAGDDTRKEAAPDRTARDASPRAAGAAPDRGAQPLPPLPGEDDDPASDPGHAAALDPGEAAEYGTERHRNLIGIIWQHLARLGYPADKDEDDEQRVRRLADVATLAGVAEIGSTSDLDTGELSAAADTLARCRNREALDVLLSAARKGGDGDA